MLNLFWPILAGLFVLLTGSSQQIHFRVVYPSWFKHKFIHVVVSQNWFALASFIIMLTLFIHKHSAKSTLSSLIIFVFFAGPLNIVNGFSSILVF